MSFREGAPFGPSHSPARFPLQPPQEPRQHLLPGQMRFRVLPCRRPQARAQGRIAGEPAQTFGLATASMPVSLLGITRPAASGPCTAASPSSISAPPMQAHSA